MPSILRLIITYCILLLLAIPSQAFPQDCNDPSCLLPLLKRSRPDTSRILLLNKLGSWYFNKAHYRKDYSDRALTFFKQSLTLSRHLHHFNYEREALILMGRYYFESLDITNGRIYFMQIITYYQQANDKIGEALAWEKLGLSLPFEKQDLIKERFRCYENARVLFRECHSTLYEINAMKEIADTHLNEGVLDLAEVELLEVLARYKTEGHQELQYTYDLLAVVNRLKGNLDKALYYNLETIKFMEINSDTADAALYYQRLAQTYEDLGDNDKSISFFRKSFSLQDRYANDFFLIMGEISKILIVENKPKEALAFLQESIKKNPPAGILQKVDVLLSFGNCYRALQLYSKAEQFYLQTIVLSDSIYAKGGSYLEQHANDYIVVSNFYIQTTRLKKQIFICLSYLSFRLEF